MNIIDFIILFFIVVFAIIGIKRGFINSAVSFLGTILVIVLSFIFKNYISILMYENLPFFKFNGFFKNVTVINIALYEFLAFLVLVIVLSILLKILVKISKLIEKILKFTIILSIPSKIAGFILGAVEGYFIAFAFLYIMSLPVFNVKELKDSSMSESILTSTPILSAYSEDSYKMFQDFDVLSKEYDDDKDATKFNLNALDLFLKYNIISVDSVDKLIERGKIDIENIDDVLNKYRTNENVKEDESKEIDEAADKTEESSELEENENKEDLEEVKDENIG